MRYLIALLLVLTAGVASAGPFPFPGRPGTYAAPGGGGGAFTALEWNTGALSTDSSTTTPSGSFVIDFADANPTDCTDEQEIYLQNTSVPGGSWVCQSNNPLSGFTVPTGFHYQIATYSNDHLRTASTNGSITSTGTYQVRFKFHLATLHAATTGDGMLFDSRTSAFVQGGPRLWIGGTTTTTGGENAAPADTLQIECSDGTFADGTIAASIATTYSVTVETVTATDVSTVYWSTDGTYGTGGTEIASCDGGGTTPAVERFYLYAPAVQQYYFDDFQVGTIAP